MAITVASIISNFNTYVGDASTDRITAAERLQYVTEATNWLQEELKNDHQVKTYELDYIDTVNYYRLTTPLADLLEGADLRRKIGENVNSMSHKSSRELAEDIAQYQRGDDAWTIERRDNGIFLVVNAQPKHTSMMIDDFEDNVAYWVADTSTSDALAATLDTHIFNQGSASLTYGITVAQSVNNKASYTNSVLSLDFTDWNGNGVILLDVYIPDVTYITSYTMRWGQSTSNYYTATVTTDMDGSAFVNGWNTLAFEWTASTQVGTPTASAITYMKIDMNYGASQTNATGFRFDYLRIAQPEPLTFYYVSQIVGASSGGTPLYAFTATTDIPYFSGQYDGYKYAVAHMAAAIAFDNLRLKDEATKEDSRAYVALKRVKDIIPSSITKESKTFKAFGVSFNRRFSRINGKRI